MKMLLITMISAACVSGAVGAASTLSSKHEFHHPQAFKQALKGEQEPGKKIYQKLCANCHAVNPMIPLGAPRIGVLSDWKSRMERTLEQMYQRVDEGFNAMPARGGCFECSDDELKAAIVYMLPKKNE